MRICFPPFFRPTDNANRNKSMLVRVRRVSSEIVIGKLLSVKFSFSYCSSLLSQRNGDYLKFLADISLATATIVIYIHGDPRLTIEYPHSNSDCRISPRIIIEEHPSRRC